MWVTSDVRNVRKVDYLTSEALWHVQSSQAMLLATHSLSYVSPQPKLGFNLNLCIVDGLLLLVHQFRSFLENTALCSMYHWQHLGTRVTCNA